MLASSLCIGKFAKARITKFQVSGHLMSIVLDTLKQPTGQDGQPYMTMEMM